MRRSHAPHAALAALLGLGGGGCSAPPEQPFALEVPALTVDATFGLGDEMATAALQAGSPARPPSPDTPEDGAAASAPDGAPGAARGVRCRLLYLAHSPSNTVARHSVASRAIAAVDLAGSEPVVVTPELTADALLIAGGDALRWARRTLESPHSAVVAERSAALLPGASLHLGVSSAEQTLQGDDGPRPVPRRVGVDVYAAGAGLTLALEVSDLDPEHERALSVSMLDDPGEDPATRPAEHLHELRREAVAIDAMPAQGAPVVILMDSPFTSGNGTTVAILVEEIPPAEADTAADVIEAMVALDRANQLVAALPLTSDDRSLLARDEALRAFRERGGRTALLLLAEESGAPLTADLAILARDADLAEIGRLAFGESEPADADASILGWRLDAAAWTLLARGTLEETLPAELEGAFMRWAGAAARFPDVVLDLVAAADGSAMALERSLVLENELALEDASAAARVAGHDWLAGRGLEVPGYDPRSPRDERRAALEAAKEQR